MKEHKLCNRDTLKSFFLKGCTPKEEHFAALIDSSFNLLDDDSLLPPAPEPVVDASFVTGEVIADGDWHDMSLPNSLKGEKTACCLLHIVAAYKERSGVYRMSEAKVYLNQGHSPTLWSPQKNWLGWWKSPVHFRWVKHEGHILLQVKAKRRAYEESFIHYRVHELWRYSEILD